eukprot:731286-Alexandrium_andersonii.AAC.1
MDKGTVDSKPTLLAIDNTDEQKEYSKTLGRWAQQSLVSLQSPEYWCKLYIAHTTRAPIGHLVNWLKPPEGCERFRGEPG